MPTDSFLALFAGAVLIGGLLLFFLIRWFFGTGKIIEQQREILSELRAINIRMSDKGD